GMPSPAWRALYRRIVAGLPDTTDLYHWGDIDEGGFRIAATLGTDVCREGRTLRHWLMSPDTIGKQAPRREATSSALARMAYWADKAGWEEIGVDLLKQGFRLEQEALEPVLPGQLLRCVECQ